RVAALPLGLGLGEVAVETAARHAHRAAQRGDGKGHPLLGDERVPHAFSLAKKVAAAFKISRSCRSCLFSRRRRASSWRSSVVSTSCRSPASASARRTHSRSAVCVRSSSRATWLTVLPLLTSFTASALNSGENDRRSRRPCCCFFCCFMEHSRAFSRYSRCPPAGVRFRGRPRGL